MIRGDDVRPMTSTNFGHRAGPAALAGMRGRRRGAPFAPLVVLTVLILGAVGLLVICGAVATVAPAVRSARIDPIRALKGD